MNFKYQDLLCFTHELLSKIGVDDFSANAVSTGLCDTSLRGVDSHGIRLLPHYCQSAISGRKNKCPKFQVHSAFPGFQLLDADDAFGHAAGQKAVEVGTRVAADIGISCVSVVNSSHPGAMACFAIPAAKLGYVCLAFTHADSLIVSTNGRRPFFGTNPICVAAPRIEEEPYCLDMATSVIPWNRLLLHRDKGLSLEAGLAADPDGHTTDDPNIAVGLLPFGGYKGYALASMVELFCSMFSGSAFGPEIPSMYGFPIDKPRKLSQFFIFIKADALIELSEFEKNLQKMSDLLRSEPPSESKPVMMPGDPEIASKKQRLIEGIPIDVETLSKIRELSAAYGVNLKSM